MLHVKSYYTHIVAEMLAKTTRALFSTEKKLTGNSF